MRAADRYRRMASTLLAVVNDLRSDAGTKGFAKTAGIYIRTAEAIELGNSAASSTSPRAKPQAAGADPSSSLM
jgi:hypothetical protein